MARLLFFGATADIVGSREIERHASTSSELLSDLVAEFPRLSSHKLLLSVNREYVREDAPLLDSDEVAIFTAVSGG